MQSLMRIIQTFDIFSRGISYYAALYLDFNSAIILLLGFSSLFFYQDRFTIALMIGKLLYLFYILQAGGDFMQGRFLSVLILVSIGEFIIAISRSEKSKKVKNLFVLILSTLILCFSIPLSAPLYSKTTDLPRREHNGIKDERGIYYQFTGLMASHRDGWPKFVYLENKVLDNYRVVCGALGINSLVNNSLLYIDACGLADPYLSRLRR